MTPIRFSVKGGVTHFHYRSSEIINFVRDGFKYGNTGMLLVRRENNILTYKGFGTIEHPRKDISSISIVHNPYFSGDMPTDEERLIPPKSFFNSENTKFMMLDFSTKNK